MGDKTKIEWTDATWNPIRGCSRISEGCRNCYAEGVANRFKGEGMPYEGLIAKTGQWNGNINVIDSVMDQPIRWKSPRRIFVNSMSDLFHENLHINQIARIFAVMYLAKQHTFQVLTKRADRMLEVITNPDFNKKVFDAAEAFKIDFPRLKNVEISNPTTSPAKNVWLGVSVEDQESAYRINHLLQTPAEVRWVSAEPLIGPLDLTLVEHDWYAADVNALTGLKTWVDGLGEDVLPALDWVVVGGESGINARPMHPDWARSLRDQCVDANVPFFFKQWGEHAPNWFNDDNGKKIEGSEWIDRIGKKIAGRTLDGQEWNQYPS